MATCILFVFLFVLPHIHATTKTIEDDYNYQFGNLSDYRFWDNIRVWYMDDDEPLVRSFLSSAHTQAGLGSCPVINWLMLRERTLQFKNTAYLTRTVDILEYSIFIEGETTPPMENYQLKTDGETWAMTEGRRRDCVYYLNLDNATATDRVFSLKEEVCGINHLPTPAQMFY